MTRNEDIRKRRSKEETIMDIIKKRKLRLFGYNCRMHDNRLVEHIVFGKKMENPQSRHLYREWLDDI